MDSSMVGTGFWPKDGGQSRAWIVGNHEPEVDESSAEAL